MEVVVNSFVRAYRESMSDNYGMAKRCGKWAGIVAFLFFLVKGLIWLGVIGGVWWAVDR